MGILIRTSCYGILMDFNNHPRMAETLLQLLPKLPLSRSRPEPDVLEGISLYISGLIEVKTPLRGEGDAQLLTRPEVAFLAQPLYASSRMPDGWPEPAPGEIVAFRNRPDLLGRVTIEPLGIILDGYLHPIPCTEKDLEFTGSSTTILESDALRVHLYHHYWTTTLDPPSISTYVQATMRKLPRRTI